MSFAALEWAKGQPVGPAKIVLVMLAHHANDLGACYPGQDTLAAECCITTRSVGIHLAYLESRGYLTRTKRFRENGSRTSDLITLDLTDLRLGERPEESSPGVRTLPEHSAVAVADHPKNLPVVNGHHPKILQSPPEESSPPELTGELKESYPQKTTSSSEGVARPKASSKKKANGKPAVPNERVEELVEALGEGFGYVPAEGSREWVYWRRIAVDLERDYQPAPEEVVSRVQAMHAEWDGKGTPSSLVKHWSRFGRDRPKSPTPIRGRPSVAEQSGVLSVVNRLRAGAP